MFETVLEYCPERLTKVLLLESLSEYDSALKAVKGIERVGRYRLDEEAEGLNHQGVLFRTSQAPEVELKTFLKREPQLLLVLDEVVDPQNLGSILRVAEASGVDAVIATERRTAPLTPAARKASAGASEIVPLIRVANLQRTFDELKKLGYWTVGTTLREGAEELFQFKYPEKVVLVLGSEGEGMRELTTKECDFLVSLPMFGKLDSLNVSQAAAVFLFEYRRQVRR